MCVPYASDSSGMAVPGLGGIAGTNANLMHGLSGTIVQSMAGLTGSNPGTIPTGAPGAGLSSGIVPAVSAAPTAAAVTANLPRPRPETAAVTGTEPVSGTPAPAVPGTATPPATFGPGQTLYGGWKGPPFTWGTDPYSQTTGHMGVVARAGDDDMRSLSPLADAIVARRARASGVAPPTPTPRPGETAAVPGTAPASAAPVPTAGETVLSGGSANTGNPPSYVGGKLPDTNMMAAYIRKRASELGIDPDIAVAVAASEGLGASTWQSNLAGGGGPGNLEASFGPFQLNDKYMGADFTRATGLRASDPSTWKEQIDFVLGRVPTTGWSPFHGAARVGIGARQGLPGLPGSFRGAGPSDSGLAVNGAPLVAFGTAPTPRMEAVNETTDPEVLAAAGITPSGDLPRPASTPNPPARRIQYVNQNSTRNQPLSPKLESILDQATAPEGVTARVVSGGQPSSGPRRTGSHRHDNGMAGDVQFIKDGRALDMNNPADLEIVKRILGRIYGSGAQGIGASPAYMGSRTYHVGFGTPAVWGAGGQGKNAPAWLVAIARGGGTPGSGGGGTAVASAATPGAVDVTQPNIIGQLARLGGGGGGGGPVPKSGMESRIQEFLTADAERRRKERERMPDLGDLALMSENMVPRNDIPDVASLAEILGVS